MKHLLVAFILLCLAHFMAAQNPNCRPTIVVRNGLAATLQPINTDADPEADVLGIWVKATDFLRSCTSPCGVTEFKYRIRKGGDGIGIPADSTVLYTCADIFSQVIQEVEIWAIDPQGNADYALTYIIVQDNLGLCGAPVQPLLPSCSSDVMRPTLLTLNGLSTNIIPSATGGTARVLAGDLVLSRTDNCSNSIPLRIRKRGQGTGVPTTTSVSFNCNELGIQEVEVWAGDLKKNWTWAITYVFVQDNGLNGSDCKVAAPSCSPDVTPMAIEVLNGLSVNMGTSGRVKLRVEEWLRKRTDNCSVPVALRISKEGELLLNTTVEFSCSELGTQEVEIWSRDLAGNWSYAKSFALVQDNIGNCGQMKSSRSNEASILTKTAGPLRLSPNPATQAFVLESTGEPLSRIVMMDMMGRTVRNIELGQGEYQHTVQVADLPAGVYQVRAGGQVLQVVVAH